MSNVYMLLSTMCFISICFLNIPCYSVSPHLHYSLRINLLILSHKAVENRKWTEAYFRHVWKISHTYDLIRGMYDYYKIISSTYKMISRTYEIISRTYEIISHTYEIISHIYEIISCMYEIISRMYEIIKHIYGIISCTCNVLSRTYVRHIKSYVC